MKLRVRAGLTILLAMAAGRCALCAYRSIQPTSDALLPKDIYSRYVQRQDAARYLLKSYDGVVAVYDADKHRTPLKITVIETSRLRNADRAMLEKGIPVASKVQLLELLEDLGS
ncbi:MAG: hypothetical protein Q4E35_04265 [Eubacteriales bacterium]|nr:hypothetical protein [Eubacteriales bacterium]